MAHPHNNNNNNNVHCLLLGFNGLWLVGFKIWAELELVFSHPTKGICNNLNKSMQTTTLLLRRRFIQTICRTPFVPYSCATKLPSSFAFLCTQAPDDLPNEAPESKRQETSRPCLSYRIEKLGKGEAVLSAFQSWMGDGFPVHRGNIFHAINRLRKLKMNKRALEVWLSTLCYFPVCK